MKQIIVAQTYDRVIGKANCLPWHYAEDLRRFKRLTMGTTIVMGRRTWESLPTKPLPSRRNIVISRTDITGVKGVECYRSIDDAIADYDGDVWFIGGAQLYQAALPIVEAIDVTWVPDQVTGDDVVLFPEIDSAIWKSDGPVLNENHAYLRHEFFYRR